MERELAEDQMVAMLAKALQLGHALLADDSQAEIFVEGKTNILQEKPEFAQLEQLKALLITLEEKSKLLDILEKTKIWGDSGAYRFRAQTARHSRLLYRGLYPIRCEDSVLGILGVIGPKRMDYKVVPLVQTTAVVIRQDSSARYPIAPTK